MRRSALTRNFIFLISILGLLLASCRNQLPGGLFKSQTPHQRYADQLRKAGLGESNLFRQWDTAAKRSLQAPLSIDIPFREQAYFEAERPAAAGYGFDVKNGYLLRIDLDVQAVDSTSIFMDLFEIMADSSEQPKYLHSADTGSTSMEYVVKEDSRYLLRVQPELLAEVSYELTIRAEASLANPVASAMRVGSFFGDGRDAGARKHEGVDIFGKRLTPVVASADGRVTRVGDNRLGGKVVWLRPDDRNLSLYYAHLDSQLVVSGQVVKTGDTLGLMGNTGNAITTPPHLHFGIYTSEGAVDPLPFLRPGKSDPPAIRSDIARLGDTLRVASSNQKAPMHSPVLVEAAYLNGYRVLLPDGTRAYLARNHLSPLSKPIRSYRATADQPVYAAPAVRSAHRSQMAAGESRPVLAVFGEFLLIDGAKKGWIRAD